MDYEKFYNETSALCDEMFELDIALEKLRCLVDDVSQQYFDKYDTADKEDRFCIVGNFDRYRVKMNILIDYLAFIESKAELVQSVLNIHDDLLKEGTTE